MPSKGLNILLIEGDPAGNGPVGKILKSGSEAPFTVECTDRVSSAAASLSGSDVDVVLFDLDAGKGDALTGCLDILKAAKGVPLIVMTGTAGEKTAMKAVEKGAQDYLIKDRIDRDALTGSISRAICRKKYESLLAGNAETFQSLVENVNVGVYRITGDGKGDFIQANPACAEIFGYASKEDFLKISFAQLCRDPGERGKLTAEISEKKSFRNRPVSMLKRDTASITVSCNETAFSGPDGKVLWIDGVLEDVTEQVKAEETLRETKQKLELQTWGLRKTNEGIKLLYQELNEKNKRLRALDRLKSDFVSTVSHELRTPLSITKEGISLVLDRITGDINEEQEQILSSAKNSIDRLTRIINDLLDISKIEAGKLEVRKKMFNLKDLIVNISSTFRTKVSRKGLELKIDMPEEDLEIFADADRITQVFTNLLGNSLKFTDKGYLEISVGEDGDDVKCRVSDTGMGIAEEDIPKAFDKFQQFGREHGPGEKGAGLGLSISKEIVELHGGKIWLESEKGKGSSFYFTLPRFILPVCLNEIDKKLKYIREKSSDVRPSFILMQITNMDEIRSVYGRHSSDDIIITVNDTVSKYMTRTGDMTTVCYPDRILGLLPQTDKGGAKIVCGKIMEDINKDLIVYNGEKIEVHVQFGVASFPEDGKTAGQLVRSAEKAISRSKKVLIVDDHPQIVRLLTHRIEAKGHFECIEAFNGKEALEKANEKLPDLIICDVIMPEMNGYEVVGHLKEDKNTRDIPIIIMSAKTEHEKIKAVLPGSIPVVSKTDGFHQLMELVEKLV